MKLLVSLIVLFLVTYLLIGIFITKIKEKFVQPLLEEGPEHSGKYGTPTMGGVAFIAIYIILVLMYFAYLYFRGEFAIDILIIIITSVGYFLIGFKDDYDKVSFNENSKGLSPKQKLIFQILVGIIASFLLLFLNKEDLTIIDTIVFGKINIGLLYYFFTIFLMVATTNATNLTDGLDGLLSSNAIISLMFLNIIAYFQGNTNLFVVNTFLIVILLAFYMYNRNPAKIFMGDVGSLTIGAILAIEAIILKVEILFIFFSLVYFIETISVILQVSYFKYTKNKYKEGKRLFLMAPIHHHFEKKGKSEKNIVFIFCLVNIISSIIGILIYFR